MQVSIIIIVFLLFWTIATYIYMFYPQQRMPIGEPVDVTTIQPEKYRNDCLHPCIRYDAKSGKYYMAQSPDFGWNNKIENPMFYESEDYLNWSNSKLIADTPEKGYNSDPNICLLENGKIFYLWRECETSLGESLHSMFITVGGYIKDGKLDNKRILAVDEWEDGDTEQCPIMVECDGKRFIYAAWYQYEPVRKNMGVAVWEQGKNDDKPFKLVETIPFRSCYTVGKWGQIRLFGHLCFVPKPLFHDVWHFDLFEFDNKLYMVSVAEKGDNIMLSVADDWMHFKTFRKPLVNNHYTENYCGYRQYYYKPTAFVKDDTLHVFYTANAKDDPNRNQLYHTAAPVNEVLNGR